MKKNDPWCISKWVSVVISDLEIVEFLNQQDSLLVQDEIQLPDCLKIGFFLGPTPNNDALDKISNGLKQKKSIKKHNIKFFLTKDLIRYSE